MTEALSKRTAARTDKPVSAIDDVLIDLDAGRAARMEAQPVAPKVRLNGNLHDLPLEVPLDVFSPLKNLDVDFPLLVRTAVDAVKGQTGDAQSAATSLVIDLLVANPGLPKDILDAFEQMGRRFLGAAAFEDLMAFRPSKEDLGLLVKGLFTNYGVSLGELSASSEPSEDAGTTSKPTSSTTTASTSEVSGAKRGRKAS